VNYNNQVSENNKHFKILIMGKQIKESVKDYDKLFKKKYAEDGIDVSVYPILSKAEVIFFNGEWKIFYKNGA